MTHTDLLLVCAEIDRMYSLAPEFSVYAARHARDLAHGYVKLSTALQEIADITPPPTPKGVAVWEAGVWTQEYLHLGCGIIARKALV